ncbi:class I SAM-dependent methyltransferase [Corynebacterium pilosum]|uniref:Cyclopropane-fatty-acyl-phospholipid synthase n=1 Tax=Corynebacterium pilosum TaxID=35756 RepID=A0A376CPH8_9CORY|nr:class I SAM-dependent methyltransferase [Corynebacterium pilosum]STC70426.1 cyclopropane-fatty-acyl-phospholipid synthase [Corynebacterium pilosum]
MTETPHTQSIDAAAWPSVAHVPDGWGIRLRARRSEAAFARACASAGLTLVPNDEQPTPDLVVKHEALFSRIAAHGWVGLAEGYLAGEWMTETLETLVDVLAALLAADYHPKTAHVDPGSDYQGGEVPPELTERYSGDGMSAFAGRFATGVPTTQRISVPSHVRGAGRGSEPATHFVDITEISDPLDIRRVDLGDAQRRAAMELLDAVGAGAGTHILEYPSAGGAIAIEAARRNTTVDAVTADPDMFDALDERLTFAGVADAVHTELIEPPIFAPGRWHGRYDAVVSAEKLETIPENQRAKFVSAVDKLVAPGGKAALQTVTATERFSPAAGAAVESLRAFIWPGLSYPQSDDVHKLVDRNTGLRVIGQVHAPGHLMLSLKLQRETFVSQLREAAADGFDAVYRRLWLWQLALREAMAREGMLDVTQFTLTHRHRRGLR